MYGLYYGGSSNKTLKDSYKLYKYKYWSIEMSGIEQILRKNTSGAAKKKPTTKLLTRLEEVRRKKSALRLDDLSDILKATQGEVAEVGYKELLTEIILTNLGLLNWKPAHLSLLSKILEKRINKLQDNSFDLSDRNTIKEIMHELALSSKNEASIKILTDARNEILTGTRKKPRMST